MVAERNKANTNSKATTQSNRQLVLFDFDGTITTKDTLAEFMIHYHGKFKYYFGLGVLSPVLAMWAGKLMQNWKAKQHFLSWFLRGADANDFRLKCQAFANNVIPALVRPGALEAIHKYKKEGATVVVVSASAQDWVKPWCDAHHVECIATNLEVKDNKITGKILGKNCHGEEKVCRIKEQFNISDFKEIIAYGDSSGDMEMLALAHHAHYKPFRN
jgi:phosphatidylglycerophosphatase C